MPVPRNRRGAAGPRTPQGPAQSSGSSPFIVFVVVVVILAVVAVCVLVVIYMTSDGAGLHSLLVPPPGLRPEHVFASAVVPATVHGCSSAAPRSGNHAVAGAYEHGALDRCQNTAPVFPEEAKVLAREIRTMGSLELA